MFEFSNLSLDQELCQAMDFTYELVSELPDCKDTPDQLRMRIVSYNLKALANILLMADDHEEVGINNKQLVLGILGTADWLSKNLPDPDDYRDEDEDNAEL